MRKSREYYEKLIHIALNYYKLSGYEKSFIKRTLIYGDPNNLTEELTAKQLKYIDALYEEWKDEQNVS